MARTATLTPLQLAALGVLLERAMHPYEAYQLLAERRTDMVVKLKPGTLYHAIGRLADSGHLRVVGTDRAGNRPERTTYEITDLGRTAFLDAIAEIVRVPVYEYPRFPLGLSEIHNFEPDRARELLSERHRVLAGEADALATALERCDERGIPRVHVLEVEYALHQTRAEVTWLESLIERIGDDHALPWHGAPTPETLQAVSAVACEHGSALHPLPPRQANPDGTRR